MEGILKAAQKAEAAESARLCPHPAEYHYYKSFPDFKAEVDKVQGSIKDALVLAQAAVACKGARPASAVDWEDANEVREWVSSALDDCMEGVDTALDRHRNAVRQLAALQESGVDVGPADMQPPQVLPSQLGPVSASGKAPKGLLRNMPAGRVRPQEAFALAVDNSTQPFCHWAPHLATVLPTQGPGSSAVRAQHPFASVLHQLSYAPEHLDASTVCPPRPLEETPLAFVDTPEALSQMASELQGETHVAVDLEHHSYRSFQGFTCLMQLSSRTKDYIVDTLALREQVGPALIGIFANPSIVKVLHGADHDILWLQRDFHLYVVNMFDTGQASRVLSYPSNSLAYMLEHFCNVKADKRFQLADWRARPLSPEMLDYARGDTHYLLYCYDRLKQELVQMGEQVPPSLQVEDGLQAPPSTVGLALATVLERSRRLCLACYEKEQPPTQQSCDDMVQKWEVSLTALQRQVLFAAALWRDTVCRELDESTGYVLPRAQLITLAQHMPGTAKSVLQLLGRSASEVVRARAPQLASAIAGAKSDAAAATAAKEAAAAASTAACEMGTAAMNSTHTTNAANATSAENTTTSAATGKSAEPAPGLAPVAATQAAAAAAAAVEPLAPAAMSAGLDVATAPQAVPVLAPKPIAPIKSKSSSGGLFGGGKKVPPKLQQQQQQQQQQQHSSSHAQSQNVPAASQPSQGEAQSSQPHTTDSDGLMHGVPAPAAAAAATAAGSAAAAAAAPAPAPPAPAAVAAAPTPASDAATGSATAAPPPAAPPPAAAPAAVAAAPTPASDAAAGSATAAPPAAPPPPAAPAAVAAAPTPAPAPDAAPAAAAPAVAAKAPPKGKKARGSLAGLLGSAPKAVTTAPPSTQPQQQQQPQAHAATAPTDQSARPGASQHSVSMSSSASGSNSVSASVAHSAGCGIPSLATAAAAAPPAPPTLIPAAAPTTAAAAAVPDVSAAPTAAAGGAVSNGGKGDGKLNDEDGSKGEESAESRAARLKASMALRFPAVLAPPTHATPPAQHPVQQQNLLDKQQQQQQQQQQEQLEGQQHPTSQQQHQHQHQQQQHPSSQQQHQHQHQQQQHPSCHHQQDEQLLGSHHQQQQQQQQRPSGHHQQDEQHLGSHHQQQQQQQQPVHQLQPAAGLHDRQRSSMEFVPVPKGKGGHGTRADQPSAQQGDRSSPASKEGHTSSSGAGGGGASNFGGSRGISQITMPRGAKESLKRKYILGQQPESGSSDGEEGATGGSGSKRQR